MKKKSLLITAATVLCLALSFSMVSLAADNFAYNSKGRIIFNNETPDTNDDVIFDANDFDMIDNMITRGKAKIADSLNIYPNINVTAYDSFETYASIIDNLTNVPDIYYYDKATEGDSCVRYIYEDGSYYPCDKNGIKTSDTPLSGTVTIVTKDDTTEPGADETQLVKCEKTQAGNLSAGSAAYVDNSFILGSGADNDDYFNRGYTEGYAAGQNNTGEIEYIYHAHGDGHCNSVPVYHVHSGNSTYGGGCYTVKHTNTETKTANWINRHYHHNSHTGADDVCYECEKCGGCSMLEDACTWTETKTYYSLGCNKTNASIDSYKCTLDESTIVAATIVYK